MFELTPEFAGTSIVVMFILYAVVLAFNIYMLYLNWKQSKVKETTTQMLEEIKKTNKLLSEMLNKKKK
ncbi:hypothetical protein AYK26_05310 [Euryarchaeota archaeon SM23-78]|nr:MAG: hypothetical protein AYK26_05310 [Euryarchaeota archaeon SM23-78]MBW3001334.1 hypothetical protein [Candidatus Woesearchaeota archaeon]